MSRTKIAAAVAGVAVTGLALAACSHVQPSLGQYAIVTGHGALSTQQVEDVVSPGDSINQGNGTTTWYFPANYRNYVTLPSNGDRGNPQAETTGPGKNGDVGMSDYTWTYVGFEVNPDIVVKQGGLYPNATSFLKFCLKYGCASTDAQNDASNAGQVRSSDPGWENMLNEVMPRAIDDATRTAIVTYGPDLWTNRSQWTDYGNKIAGSLTAELQDLTGNTGQPYFCGPGSTTVKCTPLSVTIQNVTPVDPDVVTQYNKEVSAQYAQQAATARLKAAQAIYGSDANYFLGLQDTIGVCQSKGVTCNIYVGNPPNTGK